MFVFLKKYCESPPQTYLLHVSNEKSFPCSEVEVGGKRGREKKK
jgi:hypothetical protein